MEPNKPGSKNLPDFNELDDRLIANATPDPTLVIKTNLDPKDPTENNPYYQNIGISDMEKFRDYFEERKD